MRVFITGISGFVGRRLADHLLQLGDVVGGSYAEDAPPPVPSVELFRADLVDRSVLRKAIERFAPEALIHLGGLSEVAASWKRMGAYFRVNVLGTENVLRAVDGRFPLVLASSAEVYGRVAPTAQPIVESQELDPRTPYAMTKAAAERLVLREGAVAARSFNLVGPGQSERFALPSFARQLNEISRGRAEPVLKVGNLAARRDFLHVDDGAEAYRLLAVKGRSGEVYNVASGEHHSISEALAMLVEISGVQATIESDPDRLRPADIELLSGDASRLRELGWSCERGLLRALEDLWRSQG